MLGESKLANYAKFMGLLTGIYFIFWLDWMLGVSLVFVIMLFRSYEFSNLLEVKKNDTPKN